MKENILYIVSTLVLSVAALFVELSFPGTTAAEIAWYADFLILGLLAAEVAAEAKQAVFLRTYLRQNLPSLAFVLVFAILFIYNKLLFPIGSQSHLEGIGRWVIVLRNTFLLLKVFSRLKRLASFFESITTQPAQTILLSFMMVILSGALVLMMPFTTVSGKGLPFLDALFTATSAVCVTGLIVVDTATVFTLWGQLVILALIQIGGLSIMVISYFTLFSIRQKVSFQDKLLLSYMLSEQNISMLSKRLRTIIYSSFLIEGAGALLLLVPFHRAGQSLRETVVLSVFHSVSAFCNAGFSLFSNSLEDYAGSPAVNFVIAGLIIAGGISFGVISDFFKILRTRIRALFKRQPGRKSFLALNTYVVVSVTPLLIVLGLFLIYGLEHTASLAQRPLGEQYLAAFFQSVTLRTAGFNTIPIGGLTTTTLLVMIPFMFIGAASGSTAGGIKINNVAVIFAYLKSVLLNRDAVILRNSSLSKDQVNKAFLVFFFGVFSVTLGTIVLSLSEQAELQDLMFEVVSAFGTVGLSTGITPDLTGIGKTMIIILMFIGRLGPLTILAAAAQPERGVQISYPRGDLLL
jgi:trk system potassium uptake protein TrkH